MIAGGIGVTPFRSIIRYVVDTGLTTPIHLVCSNSVPEEIAFKKEFDDIVKTHKNIKVIYTITHPEESKVKWDGLTGRVDEAFLRNFLKSNLYPLTSVFWVCGPPAMTTAVEETLEKMGIGNIREEKFTGY
jgi:ferredoxin-NADP reductase